MTSHSKASQTSIGALFDQRVESRPTGLAAVDLLPNGTQRHYTWVQLAQRVIAWQDWLTDHGVAVQARVASIMGPGIDAVALELALYGLGACAVSIYPSSSSKQVCDIVGASEARVIIVDDDDRERVARTGCPDETTVGVYGRGAWPSDAQVGLRPVDKGVEADSLACLVFTSGTTGAPKGVMHTHTTLIQAALTGVPKSRQPAEEVRLVWHLPIAHVVGKLRAVVMPLISGVRNYALTEGVDLATATRTVQPSYVVEPPRFWAKTAERVEANLPDTSAVSRWLDANARVCVRTLWDGRKPALVRRALWSIAKRRYRPALMRVGYGELRDAFITSAAIPADLVLRWQAWGVDLRVTYGLTESAGRVTEHRDPFSSPSTIGQVVNLPGWQARIAEDGELCVRGPSMFTGYWENPEETAKAVIDGWFHTGDLAESTADGHLSIVGRKKDIIVTSGGKSISPQAIEVQFEGIEGVEAIYVVGDGRKYLTALVAAETSSTETDRLVSNEITRINGLLSRPEQIKDFRLVEGVLTSGSQFVTANGKPRRRQIESHFRGLIDQMYFGSSG